MSFMKRIITLVLSVILGITAFAQTSQYTLYMMKGNVKMKEKLYEDAILLYQMAKASKDAPIPNKADEMISEAKKKIAERDAPKPEDKPVQNQPKTNGPTPPKPPVSSSSSSSLIVDARYQESGLALEEKGTEWRMMEETISTPSDYHLKIYNDKMEIVGHTNLDGSAVSTCLEGTILPLVRETSDYKVYSSGIEGEMFMLSKHPGQVTVYEQTRTYYQLFRIQQGKRLILLSDVEIEVLELNKK